MSEIAITALTDKLHWVNSDIDSFTHRLAEAREQAAKAERTLAVLHERKKELEVAVGFFQKKLPRRVTTSKRRR